ncbi:MAG: tryptophan synthase subunit alpha [Methanomassiliicoccales archaeon]|nr:tryptophan synthase subunit alpha [Methanomassiliicoccales archaeon]
MSRIASAFARCARNREGALVCYLTAGFPDEERSIELMLRCEESGADILEIGMPFSDPVADGPTIQRASQVALESGMTPARVLELVARLRSSSSMPIVLMGYYNPIYRIGEREFALRAAAAGADGLIVADLPYEESSGLAGTCEPRGLDLVQLVGPTTSDVRMREIANASRGYLYLVGSLGTTGARPRLSSELPDLTSRARRAANGLPVAVGFGVSDREQVREVVRCGAEGVIVGSALLNLIQGGGTATDLGDFVADLKSGCLR